MSEVKIRRAVEADVPEITRIYNDAILNTTATFDTEPKTIEDRLEWFHRCGDDYPLLAATIDDKLVGWALIRPFGARTAYRYTVENAIYIDCDYQGRGIGTALLRELLSLAEERGYHAMLALIVGGNDTSVKLHERFGFEVTGVMREVGRKFDQWLDILIYEKLLGTNKTAG
ncbi:MAG: N-acetyltransferase family protein [Armatimonadetes bacterium]|nr:N-acetyltransferase family protein [Armatimonadota bacterium]